MFAVSLVVPLLVEYFKNAGVTQASQRELLSSIYSFSQIIGGLLIGALADSGAMSRKTILIVSFVGSAIAYGLIVLDSFVALVVSRVVVGLVKQTMTVSTTILARFTTPEDRAKHMGRLRASVLVSWTLGSSVGALLYKSVDQRAPAIASCCLFAINVVLALLLLPDSEDTPPEKQSGASGDRKEKKSFVSNLQACCTSHELVSVVVASLLTTWFFRATSSATMPTYYQELYGMEPHHRGYLQSYQSLLGVAVQSFLVGPLLKWIGGERRASVYSATVFTLVSFLEYTGSLVVFLGFVCPVSSLASSILSLSLSSLVTQVAPKDSLGSVLAALDVLQSAAAVTVPFYRTALFSVMQETSGRATASGDPYPLDWVVMTGLHWLFGTLVMAYLLLKPHTHHATTTTSTMKKKSE